ncbi:MAG: branched-chain amino acid ABC transporter ATP-binding protein/permease [Hyphomicrobiaceae bacterium]|nr:branched-chain amino acid ABC transporter ATP-binding protein/permease [Hyphomicrobiaceae bacterium]
MSTTSSRVATLILVAVGAVLPLVPGMPVFWITLINNIGLGALVAIGLVVLTGVGGLTSFGQAAFVGFGAFTSAVLTTKFGWSPWATLPVALVITGLGAFLLGLVTMRLSGHYLPLGTIAWGLSLYFLFGELQLFNRHDGINAIPPFNVAGYDLFDSRGIFYVIWGCVALAVVATRNLLDSRTGRAIRALRGGGVAAEAFGVSTMKVKLIVFVYAALLASVAGWLYAHMQRAVNQTPFGINAGIEYLLMAVLGGAGQVWGALLGSALVTILKDQLQRILPALFGARGNYELIVFGALLVVLLQTAREGLWPRLAALMPTRPSPPPPPEAPPLAMREMPAAGEPLLSLRAARKEFGGLVAVNDVSFDVKAGEIVGLIGPNGAGKSTTFNLVTGVLPLTRGDVVFRGNSIGSLTPQAIARQGIARTFQHVHVHPAMTVIENVALGAHLRGSKGALASLLRLDRGEEGQLLHEAARQIQRVGLGGEMHKLAGSLALGQLRIVEIARALCLNPVLLLLDEPAAGLRHKEKQDLAQLLRRLKGEGVTILLVEHDMSFVMGLTDHIVVVDFGTKIAEGPPKEIVKTPAVIEAYLGGPA